MRTATSPLVWAISLFCAMGRMASAEGPVTYDAVAVRPTVEVTFDGPLTSPALEALALAEARIIWSAYGVDIGTHPSRDCRPGNAIAITVTFDDAADRRTTVGSLGSIRFLDGVPEPAIVLYPRTIAALVSATPARRFFVDAPGVLRDLILGRVLGRALAHEIGHFLLRSRQHSAVGLMRALHPAADLIEPNRRPFRLSASDVGRLVATTSSLPQGARVVPCGG
jgi:hypothetical protein